MQAVGFVQDVPRLVAQDATAFGLAGALAFQHLRAFQAHQPRMGEIEGDGETQRLVGGEEFLRQPHVRQRNDVAGGKFAMQPRHAARHQRAIET